MTDSFHPSEQIVHGLTSGVVAVGADDIIMSVNPAACTHLNLDPEDSHVGERFSEIEGLLPFSDILAEVKVKHQALPRREVVIDQPGFKRKEIGVSVSLLAGPEPYNGAIFLFVDMTERRLMERVAEMNRQLASLGELAAGVVHQLRNPLTIITGRAELILRDLDSDKHRDSMESILREARDLEDSIAKFLEFSKPFELHPETCEAQGILDRTLQLCRVQAEKKDVEIRVGDASGMKPMRVDRTRTGEAIANIVSNAIDAVDEGTGVVELSARQADHLTEFEVTDNGPGVHLGEGEDIFTPFFTKKRDGTGLGLSIAQRILSLQGGYLEFENVSGGGARFTVQLPTQHGRDL